jgi:hypothetical protein
MRSGIRYFLILSVLAASTAYAEMYKWVDKDGGIHFTDKKSEDNAPGNETRVETIEGPSKAAEKSIPLQTDGPAAGRHLYTEAQRNADIQKLEEGIERCKTTCKTERHTNGRDQAWWDDYCDALADSSQKALDVLTNDPDRYYYVVDQQMKKARGDAVDQPPYYRPWY